MDTQHVFKEAIKNGTHFGTLKESIIKHAEDYGIDNIEMLFPDDKKISNEPTFIKRLTEWVDVFFKGISRVPFSRIKSLYSDITDDEARAKGYTKGNRKKEEVISLLKRSTYPTTVYKKQKLDRDDLNDITDFNVVVWLKNEMKMMLMEEIARACLMGDGRPEYSEDKIRPTCIRPIMTDDDLFTLKGSILESEYLDDSKCANVFIKKFISMMNDYRGSGRLTMFINRDLYTKLLLAEDKIGRRLYSNKRDIEMALGVENIVSVELLTQSIITNDKITMPLAIALDLSDYKIGTDRGGEISSFEDFDIDYNQLKYLMETRCSASLVKPFSALYISTESTEKTLVGIEMTHAPSKVTYKLNELFDSTGLIISAVYDDGTKAVIKDYDLSGFDSSTVGTKTVTVRYRGKTTTFTVYIVSSEIRYIDIEHKPSKTIYMLYEEFDPTGMVVSVVYKDGTRIPLDDYTIDLSEFDNTHVGETSVYIRALGHFAGFSVRMVDKTPVGIRLVHLPDKLTYHIGEPFSAYGTSVDLVFDDGTTQHIYEHEYVIEGFDSSTPGVKTLSVVVGLFVTTFEVTVISEEFDYITLDHAPYKDLYLHHSVNTSGEIEHTSTDGMVITAHYPDGHTAPLGMDKFNITDVDTSSNVGPQELKATYKTNPDIYVVWQVNVTDGYLISLMVTQDPRVTEFQQGSTLVVNDIIFSGVWSNGSETITGNLCYSDVHFSNPLMMAVGKQQVYCNYRYQPNVNGTASYEIKINPNGTPIEIANESELIAFLASSYSTPAHGILKSNITVDSNIYITKGPRTLICDNYMVDLNNHNISIATDNDTDVVCFTSESGTGGFKNGSAANDRYPGQAGCMLLLKGHLVINGIRITNCSTDATDGTLSSGAINCSRGSFTMLNGKIDHCTAEHGASALMVETEYVNTDLVGGEIVDNTVLNSDGGSYRYGAVMSASVGDTHQIKLHGKIKVDNNIFIENPTRKPALDIMINDTADQRISLGDCFVDKAIRLNVCFQTKDPQNEITVTTNNPFNMVPIIRPAQEGATPLTVFEDPNTHVVKVKK